MTNRLRETAIKYAERAGWRIHPVGKNKRAILNDWPHVASEDVEVIDKWWVQYPNASIGVACGPGSGIWVLDVDLPNGFENLKKLEKNHGNLPDTLKQQTGSGGIQYFWKWNGTPIRNSSSKIAPNIDVRGDGGYVVIPPSTHPSGNQYKWINKSEIVVAPKWLSELAEKKPGRPNGNSYGQIALNNELAKLGQSVVGQRNDTLNQSAFSLGQLVAGGELDYNAVFSALLGVALSIGLKEPETKRTIESGMRAGALEPRTSKNGNDFGSLSESEINNVINVSGCKQEKAVESESKRYVSNMKAGCKQDVSRDGYSLAEKIKDWICNSPGSFTTSDIDKEFCLTTREEKTNRSVILNRLSMGRYIYIKKDRRRKGRFCCCCF